jgi:hypothetical protein
MQQFSAYAAVVKLLHSSRELLYSNCALLTSSRQLLQSSPLLLISSSRLLVSSAALLVSASQFCEYCLCNRKPGFAVSTVMSAIGRSPRLP